MATTIAELIATLGLDASEFNSGLDHAQNKGSGLGTALGGLAAIGGGVLAAGFAVATTGAFLLGKEIIGDIQIAMEAERVMAQLNAVLRSTGGVAGITSEEAENLAASLSNLTGVDDEAIISAQSMLLTFTDIGEGVFPQATEAVLNMATAMNGGIIPSAQELTNQSIQLGKALQDPDEGLGALKRVGVNVEELEKKFTPLMTKEEKQILILQELATEFGGSAEAAGSTAAGQFAKFGNTIENIRENIGSKFLPILGQVGNMLMNELMKPEVQAFIDELAKSISRFVQTTANKLPAFIESLKMIPDWLNEHKPLIVAILAVLGASFLAFGITVASAIWTIMVPLLPLIAIIALIGAAAYLLYTAWTENWGGIRDSIMELWTVIQPYLQQLVNWLQINIPIAIQILADYWTNILQPKIQEFFSFVATVVIPNIINLIKWLAVNVPAGIQALITWWNNLKSTVTTVFNVVKSAVQNAMGTVINHFQNFINEGEKIIGFVKGVFNAAFASARKVIDNVAGAIQNILKKLEELVNMDFGAWIGNSPSPFELSLLGIHRAMETLARTSMPQLGMAFGNNLGNASLGVSGTNGIMQNNSNEVIELLQQIVDKKYIDEQILAINTRDALSQAQVGR